MMKRPFRYYLIILASTLLLFIFVFGPLVWFYFQSAFFGEQKIKSIVGSFKKDNPSFETFLDRIADWEKEHMIYDTRSVYYYPFFPFLMFRISSPSPSWIISVKRGACEEFAILCAEMVRIGGFQSRVVYNPGEDHTWCEVLINGTWMHFDPTLPKGIRFNNPGIYERQRIEDGWGKQLSYVFSVDREGNKEDVTSRYTNTGTIVVNVKRNDSPIENARVVIKSRFLMETNENYKEPLFCLEKITNESGKCTFQLGGNNYTILVESGNIIGYREEMLIHLDENSTVYVTVNLEHFVLLVPYEYIVVILLVSALVFLIYKFHRKKKDIKNKDQNLMGEFVNFSSPEPKSLMIS